MIESLAHKNTAVHYVKADLGSKADRSSLIAQAKQLSNRLDVLVNNAGMAPRSRDHILEATEESFEEILRVNLQGPYFLTQQCAKWMIESLPSEEANKPCIININSISAAVASIYRGEYCVSKAGLSMATN